MRDNLSLPERITALEVRVEMILEEQQGINEKLDELLALKHKGLGAFWLVSSILGTSLVGIVIAVSQFFRK